MKNTLTWLGIVAALLMAAFAYHYYNVSEINRLAAYLFSPSQTVRDVSYRLQGMPDMACTYTQSASLGTAEISAYISNGQMRTFLREQSGFTVSHGIIFEQGAIFWIGGDETSTWIPPETIFTYEGSQIKDLHCEPWAYDPNYFSHPPFLPQ